MLLATSSQATEDLVTGTRCYLQLPGSGCAQKSTFLLLTGYCLLNFLYNTLGLYLTKYASSTVNAITSSLLLPITAMAFTLPALGPFREKIHRDAYYGLVVIVTGFVLYQGGTPGKSKGVEATPKLPPKPIRTPDEEVRFSESRGTSLVAVAWSSGPLVTLLLFVPPPFDANDTTSFATSLMLVHR